MENWDKIKRIDDKAENVCKFVFENKTAVAEAVLYKYPTYKERTVICISTQSGCPVGCRFCGAGDSFVRSLTAPEIVQQALHCIDAIWGEEKVRHDEIERLQIMFMSMGEPLLNMKHLDTAIRQLHDIFPKAALLISTSAPDVDYDFITQTSVDIPTVGLQFSVHESLDVKRDELIPFKKKLNLEQIADVGEKWFKETGRKPFFNYCAHNENSSMDDANRIYDLFNPKIFEATVSVVCEKSEGFAASNEHQRNLAVDFGSKLLEKGYNVRVFDPAGQDTIGGGCGQLWFVQEWMKNNPKLAKPSIGRKLKSVHAPTA